VSDDDEERPSLRRTLRKKLYPESLWALAVRACGSRIEQAEALCAAAAAVGLMKREAEEVADDITLWNTNDTNDTNRKKIIQFYFYVCLL